MSDVDGNKSSGDELESKEGACSRSGTDSDSTKDKSESDADVLEPRSLNTDSDVAPVPMPRRRKGLASPAAPSVNKRDEMSLTEQGTSEKRENFAPQGPGVVTARSRMKGTAADLRTLLDIVVRCLLVFYSLSATR